MKLIINLEANMRQFIWPRVGKYLEKIQGSLPKTNLNISYDSFEYRSISSNESLVTCSEGFRNIGDNNSVRGGDYENSEFKTCSPIGFLLLVEDEPVSIISTTNDTNSYKNIDFSCISSPEFPSSEFDLYKHSYNEELEPSSPLFNDTIAKLIEDMILVLEDPSKPIDNLPEIKELDRGLDYQEVTKELSIT